MTKFDFSRKFQKDLLSLFLKDLEVTFSYISIIEPSYFESDGLRFICKALFNYVNKYGKVPKRRTLKDKVSRMMQKYVDDEILEKKTLRILDKLYVRKVPDSEYVYELARSFAEAQAWTDVFIDGLDLLDKNNYEEIFDLCLKAKDKGTLNIPYVAHREIEQRLEDLTKRIESGLIKIGIKHFDRQIRVYAPQYNGIIGSSNLGKSWFLINTARHAMRQGHHVVMFTGEMEPHELCSRLDGGILGINSNMLAEPDLKDKLVADLKEKYDALDGTFTVVQFQPGQYSVQDLEIDLRRCCLGDDRPTVVCVDYIDLLSFKDGSKKGFNNTETQLAVSRYLRGIAYKYEVCTWAAGTVLTKGTDQNAIANRQSKSGAGDISYDFDIYIVLNQSEEDEEENQMKMYLDKVRNQEGKWLFVIRPDFSRSRFCVKSLGMLKKKDLKRRKKRNE